MRLLVLLVFSLATTCAGADGIYVKDLPVPSYPTVAKMALVEGSISVQVEINADGKVVSARATGGHPVLEKAAEDNVRLWSFRFDPEVKQFPISHTVVYTYKIIGKRVADPECPSVVLRLPDQVEVSAQPPLLVTEHSRHRTKSSQEGNR